MISGAPLPLLLDKTLTTSPGTPVDPKSNVLTFPIPPIGIQQEGLNLYKKSKKDKNERLHVQNGDRPTHQPPDILAGFPDAVEARRKTAYPGGLTKRWRLPDKKILEWDAQEAEVEKYDRFGKHWGAFDPSTGLQKSGPKKNRRVEPL